MFSIALTSLHQKHNPSVSQPCILSHFIHPFPDWKSFVYLYLLSSCHFPFCAFSPHCFLIVQHLCISGARLELLCSLTLPFLTQTSEILLFLFFSLFISRLSNFVSRRQRGVILFLTSSRELKPSSSSRASSPRAQTAPEIGPVFVRRAAATSLLPSLSSPSKTLLICQVTEVERSVCYVIKESVKLIWRGRKHDVFSYTTSVCIHNRSHLSLQGLEFKL